MSDPYANKSDAQIIAEQAASLDAKSDRFNAEARFDAKRTSLEEESGVNESGLEKEFPGASVSVGRTGQTGGGENMTIPVEEGGDPRTDGSHASAFDDVPAGEDRASYKAKTQPGDINVSGRRQEALRTNDAPADGQPQLDEQ
ncbi:hypothetical protein JCM10908_003560 [Rhodotorula pacifica]|uniref:uncharacterized protein n=1 Tax=Rhodotorula pacifica TaxID=1495444 RepID=UPI003175D49D